MQFHFVVVIECDSDAALSIFGRRFPQAVFGDNQNAPGRSEFDGGAKARDACTNDGEIGLYVRL